MTLVMEAGIHVIKNSRGLTAGSTVTNFTMISNGAMIISDTEFAGSLTIHSRYAALRGITFNISMYVDIRAYIFCTCDI